MAIHWPIADDIHDQLVGIWDGLSRPKRMAMALSDERDDCWTLFSRMFGKDGTVIETLG
jgi:hypothetical protein